MNISLLQSEDTNFFGTGLISECNEMHGVLAENRQQPREFALKYLRSVVGATKSPQSMEPLQLCSQPKFVLMGGIDRRHSPYQRYY
jgi:hypothetical protein